MADNKFQRYTQLMLISIIAIMNIAVAFVLFVAYYDYALTGLYNVLNGLTTIINPLWVVPADYYLNLIFSFLPMADYIFLGVYIVFVYQLLRSSYLSKRDGYTKALGFMTYGVLMLMFVGSIIETMTNYLYNVYFNAILSNLDVNMFFFDFYLSNFLVINLIIIIACILLNLIDFDNTSFFNRKPKEVITASSEDEL